MVKPVVCLFTRDDCRPCRCGLGRNLLEELKDANRCDCAEFNLSQLAKDHRAAQYARRYGLNHFPTFIISHPERVDVAEKIWADDNKKWEIKAKN